MLRVPEAGAAAQRVFARARLVAHQRDGLVLALRARQLRATGDADSDEHDADEFDCGDAAARGWARRKRFLSKQVRRRCDVAGIGYLLRE